MIYYKYGLNFISWFEDDKLYINHNHETRVWDLETYAHGKFIHCIFKYTEFLCMKSSDTIIEINEIEDMNCIIQIKQREYKLSLIIGDI